MKGSDLLLGFALAALVPMAFGQDAAGLAGTWYGPTQLPGGLVVELEMRVQGNTGTWMQSPRGRPAVPNPCLGRPHPMEVTTGADGSFRVHVQASKTIPGCQDGRFTIRLVDPTHVEGVFADGRTFKLERK